MEKRYFGSFSLQNTIRKVKENYPECRVSFKDDGDEKSVTFKFSTEDRKKYGLSESSRSYQFLNGHLILSNGALDPFKYDKLDEIIETSELEYDVFKQRSSIEKITKALQSCQEFHDNATVLIGNNKTNGTFDIQLYLNEVLRAYHVDGNSSDVHLQKIDPEIELKNAKEYLLANLPSILQYKILKTTHPGLLTVATEYISGIRSDKADWKSSVDAYVKPWKKVTYEQLGITPFDVLADVSESRIVGKFADRPMRRLVLIDGSEYAYGENPLEVVPYEEYKSERTQILNAYKMDIMKVCKETGVIPPRAIELMNVYTGKTGPVVLCKPEEAIMNIRIERLSEPLSGVIQKINRAVKLHNHDGGFLASLRKTKNYDDIRRIDINENGNITRVDVDIISLLVSAPYTMNVGHKKVEVTNLNFLPLTTAFINTLKTEVEKMHVSPEYKTYKFIKEMEREKFIAGTIISDGDYNVYKTFKFPDQMHSIWIDPYNIAIGSNQIEEIRRDGKMSEMLDKVCEIFDEIFQ